MNSRIECTVASASFWSQAGYLVVDMLWDVDTLPDSVLGKNAFPCEVCVGAKHDCMFLFAGKLKIGYTA